MLLLLFLIGSVWSLDQAPGVLQSALSNPKLFSSLFNRFTVEQDRHYAGAGEKRLRAGLFRNALKKVAAHNAEEGISWSMELNMFSDMTEEEKMSYTGLNITEMMTGVDVEEFDGGNNVGNPSSKDWRSTAVTEVKRQGACGSCWIFSAVGALEGHYKTQGSILKSFSEQEALDCITEEGCSGGYMPDVYNWLKREGRLASTKNAPYKGYQGSECSYSSTPNSLIAFTVTGYTNAKGDRSHETALATRGPLSVGYQVAHDFFDYEGGIYKTSDCRGRGGHAVTSVGYTSEYFRMKNSWGGRWGESGYFRIARGNVCGITSMGFAPKLEPTGKIDDGKEDEKEDDNNHDDEDKDKCIEVDQDERCPGWAAESPSKCTVGREWRKMKKTCSKSCKMCQCVDIEEKCGQWKRYGYCKSPGMKDLMNFVCKKSCGTCPNGACKEGFKQCPDKRCVHEHWNC